MTKILKVVGASWMQTKISSYVLGALGLLAIVALFLGELERIQDDGNYAATVFYSDKTGYRIQFWGQSNELSTLPLGVARAYYRQDIDTTGWAQFEIETDPAYNDQVQAYAAGMLEGALTWREIWAYMQNTVAAECERAQKDCERVKDQLERAVTIDKKNAAKREDYDPFWHQVGLFYTQIEGILVGWRYGVERSQEEFTLEPADLFWVNAMSEIREIKKHLNISLESEATDHLPGLSSALLRVVNVTIGNTTQKKAFVAHNTAGNYNSMIRIAKRYKLNYHETDDDNSRLVPGTTVEFSGYPAAVTSLDDAYILSGGDRLMTVTGTALNNFNKHLWRNVNIVNEVPLGPRVSAANHLASNGSSWAHILARNNSGTGCRQWMVLDLKQLDRQVDQHELERKPMAAEEKKAIISYTIENGNVNHTIMHHNSDGKAKEILWLLEQAPGYTHLGDLSDVLLKRGYWATYGLPYFTNIANITHLPQKEAQFGDIFSYRNSPRAKMFVEHAKNLNTTDDIITFMRTNNMTYLNNKTDTAKDEESDRQKQKDNKGTVKSYKCADGTVMKSLVECVMNEKEYWVNLGVRGDLARLYPDSLGIIDTKCFSGTSSGKVEFTALSGPTYNEIPELQINKGNVVQISTKENTKIASKTPVHKSSVKAKNSIPAFQWSKSKFSNEVHDIQPDVFAFNKFSPKWVW